jgi:hypothetical protein
MTRTVLNRDGHILTSDKDSAGAGVYIEGALFADRVATLQSLKVTGTLGFFGTTPTTKQTELTDEFATLTFTAPGTPDYAIQDLIQTNCYGFATKDEGNSVLKVIANLQTRVNELETKLTAYGLLVDAD